MKFYWILVGIFFLAWIAISHQYPEPSWWSIFNADRSTHTPLIEHVSLIKVSITLIIFWGVAYLIQRFISV